jgi:FkbM family methyltransferase
MDIALTARIAALYRRVQAHLSAGDIFTWSFRTLTNRILSFSHPLRALNHLWKLRNFRIPSGDWQPRRTDRWLWACEQTWKLPEVSALGTSGDLRFISVRDTVIAWPQTASAEGLSWIHNEIFIPSWRNPYAYEINKCKIRPGDWVLDIGACEGFFTLYAAQPRSVHIIAFEPVQKFSSSLRATVRRHGLSDCVQVLDCGLSDADQEGYFDNTSSPFEGKVSDSKHGDPIRLRSLDSLVLEGVIDRADFIKMDVEGHEEAVLRGATALVQAKRPRLAIAVYHTATQGEEVKRALLDIDPTYQILFRGMWLRDLKANPRPATLFAWPSSGK